jgi:hypothetical protein
VSTKKTQVGLLIRADATKPPETVRPHDGKKFSLKELQGFVGGYIERIALRPGHGHDTMWGNEEAKLNMHIRNDEATSMAHLFPGDYVAGDVLVVSYEVKQ